MRFGGSATIPLARAPLARVSRMLVSRTSATPKNNVQSYYLLLTTYYLLLKRPFSTTMKTTLLLLIATLFLVSCGQQGDGLAKKMSKKGGSWSITQNTWQVVERSVTAQVVRDGVQTGGTLTFEDNGNLAYSYEIDGVSRSGNALWTVNDYDIAVTYIDLAGTVAGALTVDYTIQHHGQHKVTFQATENYTDSAQTSISTTVSMEMERRY
jgi:hypothetical protein